MVQTDAGVLMAVNVNAYDLFKYVEEHFDLSRLQFKGINFWPLIRSRVAYQLFFEIPTEDYKVTPKIKSVSDRIKLPYRKLKLEKLRQSFEDSIKGLGQEIQVFVYPDKLFIDSFKGKSYSRYVDPYYEIIAGMNSSVGRFSLSVKEDRISEPYHPINYLETDQFLKYLEVKKYLDGYRQNNYKEVEKIKKVLADLNKLCESKFSLRPFFPTLIKEFNEVVDYQSFFDRLFEVSKVKFIFLECFYDTVKMALCVSAKKNDIEVIELQHGVIGDYTYLPYLNSGVNYDMMPDHLWCWTQSDKDEVIKQNLSFKYLKPFVGGNMWMKKYVNGEIDYVTEEDIRYFNTLRSGYKKLVVFTQQPLIESEILFAAISEAPEHLFFIRFHPLTSTAEKEAIKTRLKDFKNVEFEKAMRLSLYALFKYCDLQVTHSSATAVEALSFNLPTVIFGKNGYSFYKEQIADHVIFYAGTTAEIVELVINTPIPDPEHLSYYQIRTDQSESEQNIATLLKKCVA
jgi:hypothetical protein